MFAAERVAVYSSEDARWFKQGEYPAPLREVPKGKKVEPYISVEALTYGEAFEKLFGCPVPLPELTRDSRRGEESAA